MVADEQTHTLPADREGAGALRALSRLRRPRCLRRGAVRPSAQGAAALRADFRKRSPAVGAEERGFLFPQDADDRGDARRSGGDGLPQSAAKSRRACGSWLSGGYRCAERRGRAAAFDRARCRCCCGIRARRKIRKRRSCLRPFPRRAACRRAAVVAAAANPDLIGLHRAHPRHRAAPGRHPGALPACDRSAAGAGIFRLAAGRSRAAFRSWNARSGRPRLRGFPRPHPHVRPGADVPDRRAHPVRHRFPPSRRARPLPTWPM